VSVLLTVTEVGASAKSVTDSASTQPSAAGICLVIAGIAIGVIVVLQMVTQIRRAVTPKRADGIYGDTRAERIARINQTLAYGSWLRYVNIGFAAIAALALLASAVSVIA